MIPSVERNWRGTIGGRRTRTLRIDVQFITCIGTYSDFNSVGGSSAVKGKNGFGVGNISSRSEPELNGPTASYNCIGNSICYKVLIASVERQLVAIASVLCQGVESCLEKKQHQ